MPKKKKQPPPKPVPVGKGYSWQNHDGVLHHHCHHGEGLSKDIGRTRTGTGRTAIKCNACGVSTVEPAVVTFFQAQKPPKETSQPFKRTKRKRKKRKKKLVEEPPPTNEDEALADEDDE